jgi:ferric enterobactin receptor
MRLVVKAKLSSAKKQINSVFFKLLISFFFIEPLTAQTYNVTFQNTAISQALIQISKQFNIKVAFDSEKLSSVSVNRKITGNTIPQLLNDLLLNTGFEFTYRYNRYLIVDHDVSNEKFKKNECQIIGSVTDKDSGEQLPYASVYFLNKNFLVSASENGSFCIKNVLDNPVHLVISYVGYYEVDTTINWKDAQLNLDLRLTRKFNVLDTIVVSGEKMEMIDMRNDVDFATSINPSMIMDLPVFTETDVNRILQLLPGISYSENASGLSIRGGSSDQNLVLFDGQTLYNVSHYYGVVSSLNPNVIKDLQVYKGGYDSRFGERVSGIVDITGKSGNRLKPTVYGDLNLLSGNITAELPVSRNLTLIAAVRRSYSDIYSTEFSNNLFNRNMKWLKGDSSGIINQTKPSYYFFDYNMKLTYRISNLENFSISVYGAKDFFSNSYNGTSHDLIVDGTDKNKWNNYGISGTWLKRWNESLFSNIQIGTSGYTNNSSNATIVDRSQLTRNNHNSLPDVVNNFNTYNQNKLKDIYLSMRYTLNLSDINQLNFGILSRNNSIYYHKDADQIYIYDNTSQDAFTSSLYLQDRVTFFNHLTIKPGLRFSYFTGKKDFYLEPRFSANYKFSDAFSVRMATGRYNQFLSQVLAQQETGYNKNFWVLANESIHPVVTSDHLIFGVTAESGKFMLDGEIYFKTFNGIQEYIFISQFLKNSDFPKYFPRSNNQNSQGQLQPSYYITGKGKVYGVDLLIKYKNKNFASWLSYSYGRSLQHYVNINSNNEIPSPADQPHQFSWTNMLSAGRWNFSTVALSSSGKPYVMNNQINTDQTVLRDYNRLPNYFRTDLSVNYNFSLSKVKLKIGGTILNLFNTQNYFDINSRKFDFDNTSFSETTLIQSQSLSLNLFVHFIF